MTACSNKIVMTLIKILDYKQQYDKIGLDTILSLLEKLCRFSITSIELKQIFSYYNIILSRTNADEIHEKEEFLYRKQLLRIMTTAATPDDQDGENVSSYFDLERTNGGIIVPPIKQSYSYAQRRQLYSFYSENGLGFEAFLGASSTSLYLLVSDHRELTYVEIPEYVKHFKYPTISEIFTLSSIGSPSRRPYHSKSTILNSRNKNQSKLTGKMIQSSKGLFMMASGTQQQMNKVNKTQQNVFTTTDPNCQDTLFGQSTSLHGQMAFVWLLSDALQENDIKQ
ncbi:unnamed protein product [Didymodactylos carnosus]|uniref:Uncharacterized protein n=1 Tax=Didymodactylos carnosus TaxID=1234261 RepID=A0A815RV22_9BILA|nr:unnamed protein product [Didymodactylos carnosus]CAF4345189.1 unnamed protein product [Didymodactylos carnosus]